MRKHLLFTFTLFIISTHIFAQKGLFVKPYAGFGAEGVHSNSSFYSNTGSGNLTYTFGIQAGMAYTHLRLSAGVALLNNGFSLDDLVFEDQFDPTTGQVVKGFTPVDIKYTYRDIAIPIIVGYALNIGGKLSIVPELGLAPAYKIAYISEWQMANGNTIRNNNTATVGDRVSVFFMTAVNAQYNLNKHIGITLGPAYTHHINGPWQTGSGYTLYTLTANAGVILKL